QAEDGIRDFHVTGVQTCALPISNGSIDKQAPAIISWVCIAALFAYRKLAKPTGNVCCIGLFIVNTRGNIYSFHAARKANSAATPRPGRKSGNIIRQYIPVKLQPSSVAASSRSCGMALKKPSKIKNVVA